MPKSVWAAVIMIGYLLVRQALEEVSAFRTLLDLHLGEASPEDFVKGLSAWDDLFFRVLLLAMGGWFIHGLAKGKRLAWLLTRYIAGIGVLLCLGGYCTGWLMGGHPPTPGTALKLFLYIFPALAIIVSLGLPSARDFFKGEISWKRFWISVGIGAAGFLLFAVLWSACTVYYYQAQHPKGQDTGVVPGH